MSFSGFEMLNYDGLCLFLGKYHTFQIESLRLSSDKGLKCLTKSVKIDYLFKYDCKSTFEHLAQTCRSECFI